MSSFCVSLASPVAGQGFDAVSLALCLPTLGFVAFMALRSRRTLRKLQFAPPGCRAPEVLFYYAALWLVCTLFVVRFLAQAGGVQGRQAVLWNVLCLVARCVTTVLEASVVLVLLQGALTPGEPEALLRAVGVAACAALADSVAAAAAVFGAGTPLFVHGGEGTPDRVWAKWGFYLAHAALGAACYAVALLALARRRARPPAKRGAHAYFGALLLLDGLSALGALLLACGAGSGYCVFGLARATYAACFPPLLYWTFLAEALPAGGSEPGLDALYYSEMHEAGYFDAGDDLG